jgi:hypothetical protein
MKKKAKRDKRDKILFVPFSLDDFQSESGIDYLNEVLWRIIEKMNKK